MVCRGITTTTFSYPDEESGLGAMRSVSHFSLSCQLAPLALAYRLARSEEGLLFVPRERMR